MFQHQAEQLKWEQKRRAEEQARQDAERKRKQEDHERQQKAARRVKPPPGFVEILPLPCLGSIHFYSSSILASRDVARRIRVEYRDGQQPLWYIPSGVKDVYISPKAKDLYDIVYL